MKIPAECRVCGGLVDRSAAETWVTICERLGHDPIARALRHSPPGILCSGCAWRTIVEFVCEDEEPGQPISGGE